MRNDAGQLGPCSGLQGLQQVVGHLAGLRFRVGAAPFAGRQAFQCRALRLQARTFILGRRDEERSLVGLEGRAVAHGPDPETVLAAGSEAQLRAPGFRYVGHGRERERLLAAGVGQRGAELRVRRADHLHPRRGSSGGSQPVALPDHLQVASALGRAGGRARELLPEPAVEGGRRGRAAGPLPARVGGERVDPPAPVGLGDQYRGAALGTVDLDQHTRGGREFPHEIEGRQNDLSVAPAAVRLLQDAGEPRHGGIGRGRGRDREGRFLARQRAAASAQAPGNQRRERRGLVAAALEGLLAAEPDQPPALRDIVQHGAHLVGLPELGRERPQQEAVVAPQGARCRGQPALQRAGIGAVGRLHGIALAARAVEGGEGEGRIRAQGLAQPLEVGAQAAGKVEHVERLAPRLDPQAAPVVER